MIKDGSESRVWSKSGFSTRLLWLMEDGPSVERQAKVLGGVLEA